MPTGGANRKPSEQREAEGNAGHRPIPPVLAIGGRELAVPTHLGESALERWHVLVDALGGPNGILATVDAGSIESAAITWAELRRADLDVEERGQILADGKVNPSVRIRRDAIQSFRMLAGELGLSPAARARLAGMGVAGGGSAPGAGKGDAPAPAGKPQLTVHKGAA